MGSNNEQIDKLNKDIENAVQKAFDNPQQLQHLLTTMAQFPNYSMNNIMLIQHQKSDASVVQGFNSWKKQGRHVKKGEKAMKILAPKTAWKDLDKIDPQTQKPVYDKNGNKVTEKQQVITGYRPVSVFDISQTKGKKLELGQSVLKGKDMSQAYEALKEHWKHSGIDIQEKPLLNNNARGLAYLNENKITINTAGDPSPEMKFKTLIHEHAHLKLHHRGGEFANSDKQQKEAQAESVAFATSKYFQLDTEGYSANYIAAWAKDIDHAKQALKDIQGTLKETVQEVEQVIEPLELSKEKEQEKQNGDIFKEHTAHLSVANGLSLTDKGVYEILDTKNLEIKTGTFQTDEENNMTFKDGLASSNPITLKDIQDNHAQVLNLVQDETGKINKDFQFINDQWKLEDQGNTIKIQNEANQQPITELSSWTAAVEITDELKLVQQDELAWNLNELNLKKDSQENYFSNQQAKEQLLEKGMEVQNDYITGKIQDIDYLPTHEDTDTIKNFIQDDNSINTIDDLKNKYTQVSQEIGYDNEYLQDLRKSISETENLNNRIPEQKHSPNAIVLDEGKTDWQAGIVAYDRLRGMLDQNKVQQLDEIDRDNAIQMIENKTPNLSKSEPFDQSTVELEKVAQVHTKSLNHQYEITVKTDNDNRYQIGLQDATQRFANMKQGESFNLTNTIAKTSSVTSRSIEQKYELIKEKDTKAEKQGKKEQALEGKEKKNKKSEQTLEM